MKQILAVLLSVFILLGLAACGNSAGRTEQSSTEGNSVKSTVNDATTTENSTTGDVKSTDAAEAQPNETETLKTQATRVLVAYFSATNTTEGVAEHIANGLNAELYEIVPENPYTDADLNYNDNNSRTTIEMKDSNARPAISGSVENMEQYDIVFIGYPIWLVYHNLIQCTQADMPLVK